jgi:hypothetical protein
MCAHCYLAPRSTSNIFRATNFQCVTAPPFLAKFRSPIAGDDRSHDYEGSRDRCHFASRRDHDRDCAIVRHHRRVRAARSGHWPGGGRSVRSRIPGTSGVPASPSVLGAPYGRTTATAATPGVSFPMIMPDLGRIDGTKTAWRACRTFTMICVWPWHFGMASIRSSKNGCSALPVRKETLVKT